MDFTDQLLLETARSQAWLTEAQIDDCLEERARSSPEVPLLDLCRTKGYFDDDRALAIGKAIAEAEAQGIEMSNAQAIASAMRLLDEVAPRDAGPEDEGPEDGSPEDESEGTRAVSGKGCAFAAETGELILEALVAEGLLSPQQQKQAGDSQDPNHFDGTALVGLGFISEPDLTAFLCRYLHIPCIDLKAFQFDDALLSTIPVDFCLEHQVLPLAKTSHHVTIAIVNPPDEAVLSEIFEITGAKPLPVFCTYTDFAALGERLLAVETPGA